MMYVDINLYRMPETDEILTKDEVLKYLKISHQTLYKLMKKDSFPHMRLERKLIFKKSDIDAWLESKRVK